MPVYGSGIIPASGAIANELTYLTRRAFVNKMIVQLYNSSPLLAALIAKANTASGGVSSVTVPVQGQSFVNFQWSDYSGTFNQPAVQQGAFNSEFNLKLGIVPIPFLGMEGAVQLDHSIIPIIEARMNDATNVAADNMATALYNNFTDNQQWIGLPGAVDDGTNLTTYGNITRTSNTWWKGKVYAAGAVAPTRALVLQYITGALKSGAEMPTMGIMGPGTWSYLAQDFLSLESYRMTPGEKGFSDAPDGAKASFRALMVAGVPIYLDPYCPEGTLYLLNNNYMSLYIHSDAAFAFTGFQSTLPNFQLGYIGAMVTLAELVVVKPKSMARVTGFNSLSI